MTTTDLAELRKAMRAADAAWAAARDTGADTLPALAAASSRLHAEVQLLRSGITRRALPSGAEHCGRCGGFGGSSQWPGWVCFDCDGKGWTA